MFLKIQALMMALLSKSRETGSGRYRGQRRALDDAEQEYSSEGEGEWSPDQSDVDDVMRRSHSVDASQSNSAVSSITSESGIKKSGSVASRSKAEVRLSKLEKLAKILNPADPKDSRMQPEVSSVAPPLGLSGNTGPTAGHGPSPAGSLIAELENIFSKDVHSVLSGGRRRRSVSPSVAEPSDMSLTNVAETHVAGSARNSTLSVQPLPESHPHRRRHSSNIKPDASPTMPKQRALSHMVASASPPSVPSPSSSSAAPHTGSTLFGPQTTVGPVAASNLPPTAIYTKHSGSHHSNVLVISPEKAYQPPHSPLPVKATDEHHGHGAVPTHRTLQSIKPHEAITMETPIPPPLPPKSGASGPKKPNPPMQSPRHHGHVVGSGSDVGAASVSKLPTGPPSGPMRAHEGLPSQSASTLSSLPNESEALMPHVNSAEDPRSGVGTIGSLFGRTHRRGA
ncbi:uncharacterized protein BJ171DRAFT_520028 [Polychytrium aggregatum]|uniref:uncharacterized protein n=1 Tax=Polychytrium aggregatum TaxID=110093 RepID=UPI0022FDF00F|nr:uncharacterized protein BJ171DRAFT_520028 [Polychytrium aggregatum]KAI9197366.1 hypothetical protein BJ171DRAFT_520028 [Polychytrium aggregatum]